MAGKSGQPSDLLQDTPPGFRFVSLMAGLLTCGSLRTGPSRSYWPMWPCRISGLAGVLAAYSCGGSHGLGGAYARTSPYSLFIPSSDRETKTISRRGSERAADSSIKILLHVQNHPCRSIVFGRCGQTPRDKKPARGGAFYKVRGWTSTQAGLVVAASFRT